MQPMSVQVATLTDWVKRSAGMSNEAFASAHPGGYLVAMGVLSVEMTSDGAELQTFEMFRSPIAKHSAESPALAGHVFSIEAGAEPRRFTVGREADSDIMVPDPSVSATPCALGFSGASSGVTVQDLGSRNGTSVNNEPIASDGATLEDGDLLTVGRYSFQYFGAATFHAALKILA